MRLCLLAIVSVALCFSSGTLAAQTADAASAVAAAMTQTIAALRTSDGAQLYGRLAFDPRVVHAERGRAPAGAPDSVMLVWTTQARDSAFAPGFVDQVLSAAVDTATWVTCGTGAGARRCTAVDFPAIVAVSEPWIDGDRAQILVQVWYRSTIEEHPHAWFANVVWLRRVGERWVAEHSYNFAGT